MRLARLVTTVLLAAVLTVLLGSAAARAIAREHATSHHAVSTVHVGQASHGSPSESLSPPGQHNAPIADVSVKPRIVYSDVLVFSAGFVLARVPRHHAACLLRWRWRSYPPILPP